MTLYRSNKVILSAIIFSLALGYFLFQKQQPGGDRSLEPPPRDAALPQRGHPVLTRHARCRMECRDISEEEIGEALQWGAINQRKSDPAAKPCPVQAKEVRTRKDGQRIRVIFGFCKNEIRVITVIDLDNDPRCECS